MAKLTNLNVNITNVNVSVDPVFNKEKRRTLAVLTSIAGFGVEALVLRQVVLGCLITLPYF